MYINSTIFERSAEMEFYCRYALRWETENVMAVSTAIQDWLTSSMLLSFTFSESYNPWFCKAPSSLDEWFHIKYRQSTSQLT